MLQGPLDSSEDVGLNGFMKPLMQQVKASAKCMKLYNRGWNKTKDPLIVSSKKIIYFLHFFRVQKTEHDAFEYQINKMHGNMHVIV